MRRVIKNRIENKTMGLFILEMFNIFKLIKQNIINDIVIPIE